METATFAAPYSLPGQEHPVPAGRVQAERTDDDPETEEDFDDDEVDDLDDDDDWEDDDDDLDDDDWEDDDDDDDLDDDEGDDDIDADDEVIDDEIPLPSRFRVVLEEDKEERTKRPRPSKSDTPVRGTPPGHSRLRGGVRRDAPLRGEPDDDDD